MNCMIIPDRTHLLCLDISMHVVLFEMCFFSLKETGRYLTSPLINSIKGAKMKKIKQNEVEC